LLSSHSSGPGARPHFSLRATASERRPTPKRSLIAIEGQTRIALRAWRENEGARRRPLPQEGMDMGRSAIHPGEHLAEQLEELRITAAELGRRLVCEDQTDRKNHDYQVNHGTCGPCRKDPDADLLRQVIEFVAPRLMDMDVMFRQCGSAGGESLISPGGSSCVTTCQGHCAGPCIYLGVIGLGRSMGAVIANAQGPACYCIPQFAACIDRARQHTGGRPCTCRPPRFPAPIP